MKYLLVLGVVVIAAWLMMGRSRGRGQTGAKNDSAKRGPNPAGEPGTPGKAGAPNAAQPIVACAHCGLHLPRVDALADAQGRLFCDHVHRLAGPR